MLAIQNLQEKAIAWATGEFKHSGQSAGPEGHTLGGKCGLAEAEVGEGLASVGNQSRLFYDSQGMLQWEWGRIIAELGRTD